MKKQPPQEAVKEYDRVAARSIVPPVAVGIFWLVYAVLFPMGVWWQLALPLFLSLLLFMVLKKLCKPRYITVEHKRVLTEDEIWKRDCAANLKALRDADIAIEDEEVSSKIRRIELLTEEIFEIAGREPQKRPQIRRFLQYYLPTLLKLLSSYDNMEEVGHQGENIRLSRGKISSLLDTATAAFTKLSDELYAADSIDISSDITVFKSLLKQEGLDGRNNDSEVK